MTSRAFGTFLADMRDSLKVRLRKTYFLMTEPLFSCQANEAHDVLSLLNGEWVRWAGIFDLVEVR